MRRRRGFYTPDGKSAGTASTYGNTTKFYAPNRSLVGSATHSGGEAIMRRFLFPRIYELSELPSAPTPNPARFKMTFKNLRPFSPDV